MTLAQLKLSKFWAEVTPSTGVHRISAHILDSFQRLRLFRKWDKGIDCNPEDETFYTTQYQEAFLKYVENEYSAKTLHVPVNHPESVPSSNLIPSATALGSGQSSLDPYDSSSNDEEYVTSNDVAEMSPRRSDHASRLWSSARRDLNSPPGAPKNGGQMNPKLNDYHSNPMEIHSTFYISKM